MRYAALGPIQKVLFWAWMAFISFDLHAFTFIPTRNDLDKYFYHKNVVMVA